MNATQALILSVLQHAGWHRDRIAPTVSKSFDHAAGGTTATISTRYCQNRDGVLLSSSYYSEGRNILATLVLEIADITPEETADAVRNYINAVTKEIANSYAMRLYVMPGWWRRGAMLLNVQARRPNPECLVYAHPSSRLPIPCTVETFRSWGAEYLGEVMGVEESAEIDKAWGTQPDPTKRRVFRHLKTGNLYKLVTEGRMEASQEPVVVYRNANNPYEVWVRPHAEFFDGRFEELEQ